VKIALMACAAGFLLLGGCGGSETAKSPVSAPLNPQADLSIFEGLPEADCDMFNPAELGSKASVVLTGRVAGIAPGPSSFELDLDGVNTGRNSSVVVKVAVDKVAKGSEILGADAKHAYVTMGRGYDLLTPGGKLIGFDGTPTVNDVRIAVPAGTRVIAFTSSFDWTPPRVSRFEQKDLGRPLGTTLLGGYGSGECGGGLTFDQGSENVDYFEMTFDQLSAEVDKLS
jgi:hypothetical protein